MDNDDRYSSALVPVTVQAVNDHAPQFINNRQVVSVMENAPAGTSVVTVTATDSDQVCVNITFSLVLLFNNY